MSRELQDRSEHGQDGVTGWSVGEQVFEHHLLDVAGHGGGLRARLTPGKAVAKHLLQPKQVGV